MINKRIPLRTCTGCMTQKSKFDLIRVVRSPKGEISIDLKGKCPGRGAYICKDVNCLNKARKTRKIERQLEVKISDELYDKMLVELENNK